MMKKISVEEIDGERFDHYFEDEEYGSEKILREWLSIFANSDKWEVKFARVCEGDDMDAPIDADHDYNSREALKSAMETEIPDMDLDSFYIDGEYNGKDVSVATSGYGKKHISVLSDKGFKSESFLKEIGIK